MSIKLYIPKRNEKIGLCYDFYQKLMLLVSIKLILPFAINGPPPPLFFVITENNFNCSGRKVVVFL